jgi:hypothetical protein
MLKLAKLLIIAAVVGAALPAQAGALLTALRSP